MGQYFKAVNTDKREYICPWCLGEVAKLWEWVANPHGAVFTLLLRSSSDGGGGDYCGPTFERDPLAIAGRWAGGKVQLVGDYDDSKLWDELPGYRNISREVVHTWNEFMGVPEKQLTFDGKCSCWNKQ